MPSSNDDDTATHGGGGELKEWLSYRIWKIKGQWYVAAALVIGLIVGKLL